MDDNLNFFLIYFHVLCLPFFFIFYLHSLFYFTSPGVRLPSSFPLPLLPQLITLGPSLGCFQHSEIITRPATALVSSLVNHGSGQGKKQLAPGSAMKMFILYSSITSSGKSIYTASASRCLDNSGDMKEEGKNF